MLYLLKTTVGDRPGGGDCTKGDLPIVWLGVSLDPDKSYHSMILNGIGGNKLHILLKHKHYASPA